MHESAHLPKKLVACGICGKCFRESKLKLHMKTVHRNAGKKVCSHCDLAFEKEVC